MRIPELPLRDGGASEDAILLKDVPKLFLEAYPFPALVLRVRAPDNRHSLGVVDLPGPGDPPERLVDNFTLAERANRHAGSALIAAHEPRRWGVPAVSVPLAGPPRILWTNEQGQALTRGRELNTFVEPHTLGSLQEWCETDAVWGSQTPSPATVFTLKLSHPPVSIDLTKTRLPVSPGSCGAVVVLTALGSPHTSLSIPRIPPEFHAPPYTNLGPQPLLNNTLPKNATSMMISSTRAQDWLCIPDSGRRHYVTKQVHVLLDEIDWSKTPIGPREQWPIEIQCAISMAFSSFTQDCVYVGDDMHMIYNQNYSVMVPHPQAFGRPISEVWKPLWHALQPLMSRVQGGEPVHRANDLVLHGRNDRGRFNERYQSYSLLPILDQKTKKVIGIYNPSIDTTAKTLAERRLDTTKELVEQVSLARTTRSFYDKVGSVLARNSADAPFVICYSVKELEGRQPLDDGGVAIQLRLESSVGVPESHPSVPAKATIEIKRHMEEEYSIPDLNMSTRQSSHTSTPRSRPTPSSHPSGSWSPFSWQSNSPHPSSSPAPSSRRGSRPRPAQPPYDVPVWPLAKALSTRQCVIVDNIQELITGFPIRQWTELPDMAIVIPICSERSDGIPPAVMIMGLNLYRPFDTEYEDWTQVVRGHMAVALSSVIAYEEDVNRREEREKLERAKTAWFRGAANELRSPLTLIAAPLDDLKDTELNPHQQTVLSLATRNVHRLQRLVNSLLQFSRIEVGKIHGQFLPTELAEFVSHIVDIFRPVLERFKAITFSTDIESRESKTNVDPVLLEMVVSNLIMNALKNARRGSIALELKYDAEYANIAVTDSGLGSLRHVDEVCETPEGEEDDSGGGTGVGLALVNEIVRLHNGEMTVKSSQAEAYSHGATYTARIPLDLAAAEEDAEEVPPPFGTFARECAKEARAWVRDEDETLSESSHGSGAALDGLMFEAKDVLLVVDENRDVRDYIRLLFSPFCTVHTAASGRDAIALAEQNPPDLVLCDLVMREVSGIELFTALRGVEATRFVPVIILSANDDARVSAFIAGVDDYITKPFRSKELLLRVHLHMQMGKKRRTLEKLFAEQLLEVERRRIEAEESREQQEFLVDLISHEIRTPVSAILQCASLARENLTALREELTSCAPGGFYPSAKLLAEIDDDVDALDSIYQCGLVQERIAGDILSLAGVQRQMLSFHDVEVDLRTEARKTLAIFTNEGRMKKVGLNLTFGDSLDALGISRIMMDPVRVGQVVTNLIANAIRFTHACPVRQVSVHYEIGLDRPPTGSCAFVPSTSRDRKVRWDTSIPSPAASPAPSEPPTEADPTAFLFVSVRDTGPGISATEQAALFRCFHQGNKTIHTRFGGSGLGLFICKSLTELLGGGIEVDSEPGKGSTFRFYIAVRTVSRADHLEVQPTVVHPLTPPDDMPTPPDSVLEPQTPLDPPAATRIPSTASSTSAASVASDAPESSSPVLSPTSPVARLPALPSGRPLHVLIVEDNEINQRVLRRQLLKAGLTCAVASNGQEALDALFAVSKRATTAGVIPRRGSRAWLSDEGEEDALFDAVLMDLEMPVMDGLTAVRQVRKAEEAGELHPQLVIALTGNARTGQVESAFKAGMDDVIIKPYRLPDLIAKLQLTVSARHDELL